MFPSLRPRELVAFHAGKQNYRLETIGGREARREIDFSAAISDPISFTYPFSLLIRLPPLAHLLPHGTLVVVKGGGGKTSRLSASVGQCIHLVAL